MNEYFTNLPNWGTGSQGNEISGELCNNGSTVCTDIVVDFNGSASCSNCIEVNLCPPRVLPNGSWVYELSNCNSSCGSSGTSQTPCVSITVPGAEAQDFYNYYQMINIDCP